jgi:hypothetical protein
MLSSIVLASVSSPRCSENCLKGLRWQNHLSDLQVQPMQVQLRLRLQGQGNVHHWLAQS